MTGLLQNAMAKVVLLAVAAGPVEVPFATNVWSDFHWLGAGATGIAVRQVISDPSMPDEGEYDGCQYPGLDKLTVNGLPADSRYGVTLMTWPLPKLGEAVVPMPATTFPIYVAGLKSKGCTDEPTATTALAAAKASWREQNIEFEKRVFITTVWKEEGDVPFTGSCFKTRKRGLGCSLKKAAGDVELSLKLLQTSECVKEAGDEYAHGCQADRLYSGSVKTKAGKVYPFSIRALPPTRETWVQNTLHQVDVVTSGPYQFAVFHFAPVLVSPREKTEVVLRIQ